MDDSNDFPYRLELCTVEDSVALASNNMSTFWTDPTWPLIWVPKPLDYVISQAALRMPATLT